MAITYLSNLLPRLQQYNQTLNKRELFIDQPWIFIDNEANRHQYIFERDGNLVMSYNGKVQYGRWRLLSGGNGLLIDRTQNDSLLLNHRFFTKGVCILQQDGGIDHPWMLVNERVIPDLNVKRYLNNLLPENQDLYPLHVRGAVLRYRVTTQHQLGVGTEVVDNDFQPVTGVFKSSQSERNYAVENGRISRIFVDYPVQTDRGLIIVESTHTLDETVCKGDLIRNQNGSYIGYSAVFNVTDKKSIYKTLVVENGHVKDTRTRIDAERYVGALLMILVVAAILWLVIKS